MQASPDSGHGFQPALYVHPKLSQKSLQMCTEFLGDENSTEIHECSPMALVAADKAIKDQEFFPARRGRSVVFPPPLLTSAAYGLKLSSHRKHGRLVLRAEIVPRVFLHAEQADERLTLQMVSFEPSCAVGGEEEEEEEDVSNRRRRGRRRRRCVS